MSLVCSSYGTFTTFIFAMTDNLVLIVVCQVLFVRFVSASDT